MKFDIEDIVMINPSKVWDKLDDVDLREWSDEALQVEYRDVGEWRDEVHYVVTPPQSTGRVDYGHGVVKVPEGYLIFVDEDREISWRFEELEEVLDETPFEVEDVMLTPLQDGEEVLVLFPLNSNTSMVSGWCRDMKPLVVNNEHKDDSRYVVEDPKTGIIGRARREQLIPKEVYDKVMKIQEKEIHLMVDIETMSTKVNAHVFQVRMTQFDPYAIANGKDLEDVITEGLYDIYTEGSLSFELIAPPLSDHRHVSESTKEFWFKENRETLMDILERANERTGDDLWRELIGNMEFVKEEADSKGAEVFVWGNGPSFDNVILRDGIAQHGGDPMLIPYYNDRCVRTVTALGAKALGLPVKEFRNRVKNIVDNESSMSIYSAHDARYDTVKQILEVNYAIDALQRK